jgi:hypothetical protein
VIFNFTELTKMNSFKLNLNNKIMRKLFTLRIVLSVFISFLISGSGQVFAVGDAGVQNIISPTDPVCKGFSSVDVVIYNFGGVTISTVNVNWRVNGVVQTPFNYTGSITAGNNDTVSLGNFNFNSGSYNIEAWTSDPNGSGDSDNSNDTAMVTVSVGTKLTGTYTIAGSSPDFADFNTAVSALIANGICGPVVFNLRAHTDTMQCVITPIIGADSINTITFQSENGDSTSVILTYPSQDTLINNYLISLNGADYITFRKLTLQRTGIKANAHVVEFTNNATNNTITNCRLIGGTGAVTNSLSAILYSANVSATNDSVLTFTNNLLKNGSLGIYMNGISSLSLEYDITITNNTFSDQYSKGIQMTNIADAQIIGNSFSTISTYAGYTAIWLDRSLRPQQIRKNNIMNVPGTGMYFVDCTAQSGVHAVIANNFVHSKDSAGISVVNCDYQDFVHNTVLMTGTVSTFSALFMRGSGDGKIVKNNILANTGGGYSYVLSDSAIFGLWESDYNNFYNTGAFVGSYDSVNQATVANWIAASNLDSNSININPGFVSASDLHATSQAMDDQGDNYNKVTDDYDGQVRSLVTPDIGADEYSSISRTVGVTAILNPVDSTCGNATTSIIVIVSNTGGNPESGFPVTAKITGTLTTTLNATHTATLAPGASDTITFGTTINTAAGGTYNIQAYTSLALDDIRANDTLTRTFRLFAPPANPTTTPASICGPGFDTLSASSSDTIRWYNASSGGTLLDTGSTFITPTVVATTTYYVSAKSVCEGTRIPVTLTVLPVPSVNLGNDTSIAQGNSVTLNAGAGFTSYLWSPGGQTTQSINVNASGCYSVRVTNASNCQDRDTLCVTVQVPTDVGITQISSPADLDCADDSVQVLVYVTNLGTDTASNVPVTVNITGLVTATFTDTITSGIPPGTSVVLNMGMINHSAGGMLTVTAYTSYTNDLDNSNDTLINVDTIIVQPATPTGIGGTRCGTGTIVLISSSLDSVYWFDAVTGGNLLFIGDNYVLPGLASTTTFYAQAGNYCSDQTRTPVTATINPLPSVFLGNDTTVADSLVLNAGSFVSYQWSNFSTTQSITVYNSGLYSVCVTDSNGCSNCDTIDVGIFVGIDQITTGGDVNLYPNPARTSFTVEMKNPYNGNVSFTITNMQGQIVMIDEKNNVQKQTYNVTSFAKGVYFLRVQTEENLSIYRLIVE